LKTKLLPLVTPGEMLVEEFLQPLGLTEYRLAKDIGVPPRRINEIVHGKRAISTDTAFRLSQYFGNSSQFWLNLQADYELRRMNARARCLRSRAAPCSPRPDLPLTRAGGCA
jgi:addiction module HigA family antidote